MRYVASDKHEIIQLVQNSDLSVRQTLARLDIHKSTFYNWLKRYQENGIDGLPTSTEMYEMYREARAAGARP